MKRTRLKDGTLKYSTFSTRQAWLFAFFCIGIMFLIGISFFLMQNGWVPGMRGHITDEQEHAVRAHTLSDFITPKIAIDDSSYVLTDSIVRDISGRKAATSTALTYLRTAEYVTHTRLDPIMALPEIDIVQTRAAAREIESYLDVLEPYYSKQEMALIRKSFHPTEFLRTLPELETARRALIENPSPKAVQTYDQTLTHSLRTYRVFTKELLDTLPDIAEITRAQSVERNRGKSEENVYYVYFGGRARLSHMGTIFTRLHTQALHLSHKHAQRMRCFEGDMRACEPLREALEEATDIPFSINHSRSHAEITQLPDTIEKNYQLVRELLENHRDGFAGMVGGLDAIMLTESVCNANTGAAYFMAWHREQGDGDTEFKYMPITDLYFFNSEETAERGSREYFESALDYGLSYVHQPLGNLYTCPDNGAEAARLATIATITKKITSAPIFTVIDEYEDTTPLIARLADMERTIMSTDVMSETLIAQYLNGAAAVLREKGERQLADEIGETNVRTIESMLLAARAQTPLYENNLTRLHYLNNRLPDSIDAGTNLPFDYLFITRGGYMQLLLGFNETVIEPRISFFVDKEVPSAEEFGLYGYREHLDDMFTRSEILDMIMLYDRFYLE